jgi:hypothetical protein
MNPKSQIPVAHSLLMMLVMEITGGEGFGGVIFCPKCRAARRVANGVCVMCTEVDRLKNEGAV